jgi:hypothetical protein
VGVQVPVDARRVDPTRTLPEIVGTADLEYCVPTLAPSEVTVRPA